MGVLGGNGPYAIITRMGMRTGLIIVILLSLLGAFLSFRAGIHSMQVSRRKASWPERSQQRSAGWRYFGLSVILVFMSIACVSFIITGAVIRPLIPARATATPSLTWTATETPSETKTNSPVPTSTSIPTDTPITTPTHVPSATNTRAPTWTPRPTDTHWATWTVSRTPTKTLTRTPTLVPPATSTLMPTWTPSPSDTKWPYLSPTSTK